MPASFFSGLSGVEDLSTRMEELAATAAAVAVQAGEARDAVQGVLVTAEGLQAACETAETNAETAETNAETAAALAAEWASKESGTVADGLKSAKQYAADAAASAATAAGAAGSASAAGLTKAITDDYTITTDDLFYELLYMGSDPITVTAPADLWTLADTYGWVQVVQGGTGKVTVVGESSGSSDLVEVASGVFIYEDAASPYATGDLGTPHVIEDVTGTDCLMAVGVGVTVNDANVGRTIKLKVTVDAVTTTYDSVNVVNAATGAAAEVDAWFVVPLGTLAAEDVSLQVRMHTAGDECRTYFLGYYIASGGLQAGAFYEGYASTGRTSVAASGTTNIPVTITTEDTDRHIVALAYSGRGSIGAALDAGMTAKGSLASDTNSSNGGQAVLGARTAPLANGYTVTGSYTGGGTGDGGTTSGLALVPAEAAEGGSVVTGPGAPTRAVETAEPGHIVTLELYTSNNYMAIGI